MCVRGRQRERESVCVNTQTLTLCVCFCECKHDLLLHRPSHSCIESVGVRSSRLRNQEGTKKSKQAWTLFVCNCGDSFECGSQIWSDCIEKELSDRNNGTSSNLTVLRDCTPAANIPGSKHSHTLSTLTGVEAHTVVARLSALS